MRDMKSKMMSALAAVVDVVKGFYMKNIYLLKELH